MSELVCEFDSVIEPILLYGCDVWGFEDVKDIERVHLKFCKIMLGLSQYTTSAMIYGELGRVPLSVTIKTRIVAFWHRLITSPVSKLSSAMYDFLFHITKTGRSDNKWLNNVKNILDECGLSYIWLNQNTITKKNIWSWLDFI